MNAERRAFLGIAVRRGRWRIIDQAVPHPGTGSGRALHDLLRPTLLAEADRQGIVVEVFAASTLLAERHKQQLPGVEIIRRSFLRGFLLRREPRAAR